MHHLRHSVQIKIKGGERIMKKALTIVLALLISVAFVTTVFAQAEKKAAAPAPAAAPDKAPAPDKAKAEKKAPAAAKAKVHQFTGEVTASDAAAKTITVKKTVKGKDEEKTFDVAGLKDLDIKAGDKVTVKYTEADGKNVAKSVKKAAAKKAAPKAEKKEAPKAEPKPAPAPAK
jgi:Na+-transporting methylmalonyl-CoA/oxaloacetate decarboxylase gamma subunit